MEWPQEWYAQRSGEACPLCEEGRPESTPHGVRFFAGEVCDAYLVRAGIQRGLTLAVWRGRHVVEPFDLDAAEAAAYGAEVMRVARALWTVFEPVKLNYDVLGNAAPHLHVHLVPRYADDPRPGWPFPFPDPEPPAVPEERLLRDVDALRRELG